MIKKLMKEEKEKIVLADVGIFYVAVGNRCIYIT